MTSILLSQCLPKFYGRQVIKSFTTIELIKKGVGKLEDLPGNRLTGDDKRNTIFIADSLWRTVIPKEGL
jgi:hypothetical protein